MILNVLLTAEEISFSELVKPNCLLVAQLFIKAELSRLNQVD
jgi:hypothetical protein